MAKLLLKKKTIPDNEFILIIKCCKFFTSQCKTVIFQRLVSQKLLNIGANNRTFGPDFTILANFQHFSQSPLLLLHHLNLDH